MKSSAYYFHVKTKILEDLVFCVDIWFDVTKCKYIYIYIYIHILKTIIRAMVIAHENVYCTSQSKTEVLWMSLYPCLRLVSSLLCATTSYTSFISNVEYSNWWLIEHLYFLGCKERSKRAEGQKIFQNDKKFCRCRAP